MATTKDVERSPSGKLSYRGIEFDGYNNPKKSNREGKQMMVLAKDGDNVKIVHFGDPSMKDNYSKEANDAFYARFGDRPEINDKFSPLYWSARILWPRGAEKGKGVKDMSKSVLQSFTDKLVDLVAMTFGTELQAPPVVEVTKALDLEQRRAMFVVLAPNEVDEHGDMNTEEAVEKACISFNTMCNKANLFHRIDTQHAVIEQSYITPVGFTTDTGIEVKKGSWVQWWAFDQTNPNSELLWKMVKDGEIQGISVGATAVFTTLEGADDES